MNTQDKIIIEFEKLADWDSKYLHIIQLGKKMQEKDISFKRPELKVSGCQSRVWLDARLDSSNIVILEAESDSIFVKGLICLLLEIYSNKTPDEILSTGPDFIEKLGLQKYLSATRHNGLYAVLKKIKSYALAFKHLERKNL